MSSELSATSSGPNIIQASELGKCYKLYDNPKARLKQAIWRGRKQYYREFWALKNVSFELKSGDSLGIIGRNGSGKSTLLQIICGTLTPTEGKIKATGRIAALLELGSGFNPEFTGIENIYLNATMLGLSNYEVDNQIDNILAFADIGDFVNQPVKTYSSGMAVRLAFAVIAHVNADILVIDEALAVGDTIFVQRCMRFIQKMRAEKSLIFVSHDSNTVKSLCSHSLWLKDGECVSHGNSNDICLEYQIYCSACIYGETVNVMSIKPKSKEVAIEEEFYSNSDPSSELMIDEGEIISVIDNLESAKGWKTGDADLISVVIKGVGKFDEQNIFRGGEDVKIEIKVSVNSEIKEPAIGFTLTNNLGVHIVGENTLFLREKQHIFSAPKGSILTATFIMVFPMLPSGEYLLMASIADGTLENNVQHHWVENANVINVSSTRTRYGLVGAFIKNATLDMK